MLKGNHVEGTCFTNSHLFMDAHNNDGPQMTTGLKLAHV